MLASLNTAESGIRDSHKKWIKRYRTEIAASTSSVLSTFFAFPLDSVKTRMQTYKYNNFVDCVRHTYQTEKIGGFFRGVTAPLASITLVRTISFSVYQRSKYKYAAWMKQTFGIDPLVHVNKNGTYPNLATITCFGAAGATAGSFITLVAFRDTLGTAIYFMTYESSKQLLTTYRGDQSRTHPFAVVIAGGLCGVASWALIYPIDSAKSIYQRNCLTHRKGEM
ncbi:hypothetical protein DH86_00001838, partial [Scytalidium sp. 3C]